MPGSALLLLCELGGAERNNMPRTRIVKKTNSFDGIFIIQFRNDYSVPTDYSVNDRTEIIREGSV